MPTETVQEKAAARFGRSRATLFFLAFLLVEALRLPQVLFKGRFFAEEATNFFAYAWHVPGWAPLWHPLGGYLNIMASGSTLAAARLVQGGWLALEHAPYVTILVALAFQTLPALLVLASRDAWLAPRWAKPLALFLLATVPITEEVWLHSLHSQFHLTICVALIAAMEVPAGRAARGLRLALLALAPLTGPAAIVLLPVLGLRALIERSASRAAQAGALALAAAVQMLGFYSQVSVRNFRFDPVELAQILAVRHVALPIGTPTLAYALGDVMQPPFPPAFGAAVALLLCAGVFGALCWAALRHGRSAAAWLILPALLLALVSYLGALAPPGALLLPYSGQRYGFVPQAMFDMGILALATTAAGRVRMAARWALGVLAVAAAVSWPQPDRIIAEGPDWRAEVAAWRQDPHHALVVWPSRWTADLSPDSPACASVPAEQAPSWCDEAWLERQKVETVTGPKQPPASIAPSAAASPPAAPSPAPSPSGAPSP